LDELVLKLNPGANLVGDDQPYKQPPHIRSSYLLSLDSEKIQIDGIEAALLDNNRPDPVPHEKKVKREYEELWSPEEFVENFVNEVNQTGGLSEFIDRDKFYKWVMALETDFDKHSIFYDEDHANDYNPAPPKELDVGIVPYLSFRVGANILKQMKILKSKNG